MESDPKYPAMSTLNNMDCHTRYKEPWFPWHMSLLTDAKSNKTCYAEKGLLIDMARLD